MTPPTGREVVAVRVLRPPLPLDAPPPSSRTSAPWRVEEGWWRPAPVQREYVDVETFDDGVYRMYRDGTGWRVDGRVGR